MTKQTQISSNKEAAKQTKEGKTSGIKGTSSQEVNALNDPDPRSFSPEEREQLIAEHAYQIAEQRSFQGDSALDDWLQAEKKIDEMLSLNEVVT